MLRRVAPVVLLLSLLASMVPAAAAGPERTGRYIVMLKGSVDDPGAVAREHARDNGAQVSFVYRNALKGYAAAIPESRVAAIRSDARVLAVDVDAPVQASSDAPANAPTGVHRSFATDNGEISINGVDDQRVDVDVAIIDTGIDIDHPDLNVAGGKNCQTGTSYDDGNGHGTHVAGTVGGLDKGAGVVGMAPGARVWAVRVLSNSGSGSWSTVICGIDWVTAQNTDADPGNDIEVANMSLGGSGSDGPCTSSSLHQAICRSVAAGTTYAVAAGNDSANAANSVPAAYDEVITVSALADFNGAPGGGGAATCRSDVDDTFANFSNYGADVDVIAPGVCIRSAWKGGGYNTISGTSMASPHVAGAAALYKATNPAATPAQVQTALTGAGNLGWDNSDDKDTTKEPLLDVSSATLFNPALIATSAPAPVNSAPTVSVDSPVGGSTVSGNAVAVSATASDTDGTIAKVEFFADSATTPFASDTSADGGWTATWDSTTVGDGSHTIRAVATDNGGATGSASVSVVVDNVVDSSISLTGRAYKVKGVPKVDLVWTGATAAVDVFRDTAVVSSADPDGKHTDTLSKGGGTYVYKVCYPGTETCSNTVTVVF